MLGDVLRLGDQFAIDLLFTFANSQNRVPHMIKDLNTFCARAVALGAIYDRLCSGALRVSATPNNLFM